MSGKSNPEDRVLMGIDPSTDKYINNSDRKYRTLMAT